MQQRATVLRRLQAVLASLLCIVLSSPAWAQSTTGTIKGEVVDQADTPLSGVKLRLSSDALQGTREATTAEDGAFRFLGLPPGSYRLDVEKEGFKTIIRTNLDLSQGRTLSLHLVMEVPEVGETVEVIDRRPVVDTESSTGSITLSSDFLEDLPSGRSFQDVVQFLPGVTGGANPNINGGTANSNQYYLDGTSTTDPVTGTFSMNFNFDAIQDLEVITAGYDARYNQGLGGTINIVTKSGGNTFEGRFSGYYESSTFTEAGGRYISFSRPDLTSAEINASLGGPIVKDRFWFYVAYQFNWQRFRNRSARDVGRDFGLFPLKPEIWKSHYILAKLTAQPFARNKFTFEFRADPTTIENIIGDVSVLPEAEAWWRQGGFAVSLQHELQIGGRALLRTTGFYQYSTIFFEPILWKDCEERDEIGRCADADKQSPRISGQQYGLMYGSWGNYNFNKRHRATLKSDFEWSVDRLLGSHTIYAGFELTPLWEVFDYGYSGSQWIFQEPVDANGNGIYETAEVSDLDSYENVARYVIRNLDREKTNGLDFSLYVQDSWVPVRGLRFLVGGRFLKARLNNNLGQAIIDTSAFSWGPSVVWDPFRDGKTRISVSFAQLVDPGILMLSDYLNRASFNAEYYSWDATQQKWSEDSTRATTPASNITHPDFVPMRDNEIYVSLQREIARDLRAEVDFLYRRFTNMWEDDEVNVLWNADGTDNVGFRNGSATDVYRLRTPQQTHRNYWGLTLLVQKQLSENFGMLASYTYSRLVANTAGRSRGDSIGLSADFDNATQRYNEDGLAGFDRPHVLKLIAKYDNPSVWKLADKVSMGYALAGALDFESGQPLDRLQYNRWTQGFSNYVYKRGTRERLPAYFGLDLRGSLALKIAGVQVDLIVQVFNVLNSLDVVAADSRAVDEEDEVIRGSKGGAVYAQPISWQFPRRWEFGVRVAF